MLRFSPSGDQNRSLRHEEVRTLETAEKAMQVWFSYEFIDWISWLQQRQKPSRNGNASNSGKDSENTAETAGTEDIKQARLPSRSLFSTAVHHPTFSKNASTIKSNLSRFSLLSSLYSHLSSGGYLEPPPARG